MYITEKVPCFRVLLSPQLFGGVAFELAQLQFRADRTPSQRVRTWGMGTCSLNFPQVYL